MNPNDCECGATAPHVGFAKQRIRGPGGCYVVGCTRCGRVSLHGRTKEKAIENWNKQKYYFGPVKEDK